jgi:heterodisulfide reductase subunit B
VVSYINQPDELSCNQLSVTVQINFFIQILYSRYNVGAAIKAMKRSEVQKFRS